MNITIVTPPPIEPVTVAEAALHLRMEADEAAALEPLLTRNIRTAREFAEAKTCRAFVMQTIRLTSPDFRNIRLYRPPFIQLESVEYHNIAEATTVLDPATDFYVTDDLVPRLLAYQRIASMCTDLAYWRDDAVSVTYTVGFPPEGSPPVASAALVPAAIKDAILLHVQLLCDRFDAGEKADLERTRDALLDSKTVHNF